MVARALWRSEALRGLCLGYVPALAYGSCRVSDQGTTLRASDLHNAQATILNPFNTLWLWLSATSTRLGICKYPIIFNNAVHCFLAICCGLGLDSIKRWHLTSIENPIMEIRRSYDRLISTMGFPILVEWHLYFESGPNDWCPHHTRPGPRLNIRKYVFP